MPSRFFITGTDTGVGKTVVSAMLCAALEAIYWKPIQTGTREGSDRVTVMRLAGLANNRTIPEVYRFSPPVSPHLAAERAGIRIELKKISVRHSASGRNLIVEGAGGVFVPINDTELMIDLMSHLSLPVVLVSRTKLGTINHTLLSVCALRKARLNVHGVIMVGRTNSDNRIAIERYGRVPVLGSVPLLNNLDRNALIRAFHVHIRRRAFDR